MEEMDAIDIAISAVIILIGLIVGLFVLQIIGRILRNILQGINLDEVIIGFVFFMLAGIIALVISKC